MAKYRKTALIEATQWFASGDHDAVVYGESADGPAWGIRTLEGFMTVLPGDWIAGPGAAGEFWPIKHEIFKKTYEAAE